MTEIYTGDEKEYRIRPIIGRGPNREVLTFDVKCKNDAHIALLSGEEIASPMIEIFIGGWKNTKSAIRFNQTKPDKAEEATPDIVSPDEYRRFWVRFSDHVIKVGQQDEAVPFLVWDIDEPFEITHYAFATAWGSSGFWIFDEEVRPSSPSSSSSDDDAEKIRQRGKKPFFRRPGVWLDVKEGLMPMRTVLGGNEADGEKIYVGRAKCEGAILPGKVVPSHKTCYMGLDGVEHGASRYQVLVRNKCCELVWVPATEGVVPFGALQGGISKDNEPLFIARAIHDEATTIGWVNPAKGVCSCSYGGEEHFMTEYDVLVVKYIPL